MSKSENLVLVPDAQGHIDLVRKLAREAGLPQTIECIEKLRPVMTAHFETEERPNGFLDNVGAAAPRLQRRVERVREEHQELLRDLDHIQHQVAIIEAAQADLAARKKNFLQSLLLHERSEADLQFEAYYVELGGGD